MRESVLPLCCPNSAADAACMCVVQTEQQNNKQGMGFVIFGQLCSRRFSWQLFVFAAAVLTTGVGMLYEAIGVL